MGLFDNLSGKELKKMREAEFIKRKLPFTDTSGVFELIDRKTGVRYIFCLAGYAGGLTPRLNPDGTVMTVDMNELNNL